jgi:pilin isopeptide linkage protein
MKKLLGIVLALALVLTMNAVAFAEEDTSVAITKKVEVVNDGTAKPAETFTFTVGTGSGVRDGVAVTAPAFTDTPFTITVGADDTEATENIDLPTFTQVGVYTYPITETAGNTAGMVYDTNEYKLVVTVINNPAGNGFLRVVTLTDENNVKKDDFENEFYAGDLTINKVITGNYADPEDEFEITVTVTPDEEKVINPAPIVWNTEDVTVDNGVYTAVYTLKGGDSVTIQNLPYDVSYTVVETEDARYDEPQYDENVSGRINAAAIETIITNSRDIEIATGINLDSLPYFIILAVAIGGLALFIIRRRKAVIE